MTIEEQILEYEGELLIAIKNGNISVLEGLLHEDLVFNIPTGQTISKEMDLLNYSSGIMNVDDIQANNYLIKKIGDNVIVTAIVSLNATYSEQKIEGTFRYLRIWKYINNSWQIIAGSGIQVE